MYYIGYLYQFSGSPLYGLGISVTLLMNAMHTDVIWECVVR